MIIGVDAGCLAVTDERLKAGVYYVVYNLLIKLAKIDTKNTYLLYSFRPIEKKLMRQFPKHTKNIVLPSFGWLYFSLPLSFLFKKPDVFLATSQAMPIYHPFKTIGLIHAMDFLPEFHPGSNSKLKRNSEYVIKHADILITTSEFLKKSLTKIYHSKNVVVANLGVNKLFFQNTKKHKFKDPYFLFVGSLKPSKNIPKLLTAFAKFLKNTKKSYKLMLIGSDFWLDAKIAQIIQKERLKNSLIFIPSMPNKELITYYSEATAFISPSLYEAFGLPFLEAMSAGCPVIGPFIGGVPEVVGDAGILVNPKKIKDISDAMEKMTDINTRKRFIEKGKKRAKQFTWEKFAKSIYTVLKSYEQ